MQRGTKSSLQAQRVAGIAPDLQEIPSNLQVLIATQDIFPIEKYLN